MEKVEILIKYHDESLPKIEKIEVGDWIDLRSAEDLILHWGEERLISLGVSMKLPNGYEAQIAPRSSTFKNYGILMTNSIGIIDNSYSGTNDIWRFPAMCLSPRIGNADGLGYSIIKKGDRICQFRIVPKQPSIKFVEVEALDDTDRGGFGSTGKE